MLHKIRLYLSQGNHAQWLVFVIFALSVFIKCVFFHLECFRETVIPSIWHHTLSFLAFCIPKLAPAVTIASFVFVTKGKWWTVIFSILLDIWILSNLIYFRANEMFLNIDSIMMANNMHGFWGSVETYFKPLYFIYIAISLLYYLCLSWIQTQSKIRERKFIVFLMCFTFGIALNLLSHASEYHWTPKKESFDEEDILYIEKQIKTVKHYPVPYRTWRLFIPFQQVYSFSVNPPSYDWTPYYIKGQSIIQYALAACLYHTFQPKHIGAQEICGTDHIISKSKREIVPTSNLIIIIIESLESWIFENESLKIAPNISKLKRANNILYCDKLKSQVRAGTSGDGQMTINTGLLATNTGAACIAFADNIYPNYAHLYDSTYVFNPCPDSWNQKKATRNYGYKRLFQRECSEWEDDALTFARLDSVLLERPKSFCLMALTITSHSPFKLKPIRESYQSLKTPKYIKQYMSCVHYTDSCLGHLVDQISKDSILQYSTIVITGDHTIFKPTMLEEFHKTSIDVQLPKQSFVPLIIYSPNIQENVHITDTCYQMDIFPTIMNLIGCEDYYWKGVGVNLMDSAARNNRILSEQEAFELSDKLIRSNYFATINH